MHQPFHVSFGTDARTLLCERDETRIVFTFDIDDASTNSLVLEHHPRPALKRAVYEQAFEAARRYLQERSFHVISCGEARFNEETDNSRVVSLIQASVADLPPSLTEQMKNTGIFICPEWITASDDQSGTSWQLWRVFQARASDLSVVFDPIQGHYGICQGTVFHGFWGNLEQTLRAISDA